MANQNNTTNQAKEKGHDLVEDITKSARGMIEDTLGQVVPAAKEAFKGAEDKMSDALGGIRKIFKKHPERAILVGLGIGCLIGLALKRSKSA